MTGPRANGLATQDVRIPPYNAEAERAVLGCVLLAPERADEFLGQLHTRLFYLADCQHILRGMMAIQAEGKPLSVVALIHVLTQRGRLAEVGGADGVIQLQSDAPNAEIFAHYLEILRDQWFRRGIVSASAKAIDIAHDITSNPASVLEFLESSLRGVAPVDIRARPIGSLLEPPAEDPAELLRHRYLCRGGGLLLVGQSGQGKSSLAMQMAVLWSIGRSCFGLAPARPMRILIIQAENDDGDMWEAFDGVTSGLDLSPERIAEAGQAILLHNEDTMSGADFLRGVVDPLARAHRPDLIIIDPALAYCDGDTTDAEAVGDFLRRGINPILHRANCACMVIHHATKRRADGPQSTQDFLYAGAGSIEWTNWARAVLALETIGKGVYRLHAPKRGTRIGWRDGDEPAIDRYIKHTRKPGQICWLDVDREDAKEVARTGKGPSDLLVHVPVDGLVTQAVLFDRASQAKIGVNKARALLEELLESGDLHRWFVRRPGTRPQLKFGRKPQPQSDAQQSL